MPIIRDYIDPRDLPYTADAVVWREGDYYVAKIDGRRGENSDTDFTKLIHEYVYSSINKEKINVIRLKGDIHVYKTIQPLSNIVFKGPCRIFVHNGIYLFGNTRNYNLSKLENFGIYDITFVQADESVGDRLITNGGVEPGVDVMQLINFVICNCKFINFKYGEIGIGLIRDSSSINQNIYVLNNYFVRNREHNGYDFIDISGMYCKVSNNYIKCTSNTAEGIAPSFLIDSEIVNNYIEYDENVMSNGISLEPWIPWSGFNDYCFINVKVSNNTVKNGSINLGGGGNYNFSLNNCDIYNNRIVNSNTCPHKGAIFLAKCCSNVNIIGNELYNASISLFYQGNGLFLENINVNNNNVIMNVGSFPDGSKAEVLGISGYGGDYANNIIISGNSFIKTKTGGNFLIIYYPNNANKIKIIDNKYINAGDPLWLEGVDWTKFIVDGFIHVYNVSTEMPTVADEGDTIICTDGTYYYIAKYIAGSWKKVQLS